jgi:hypothetical protein
VAAAAAAACSRHLLGEAAACSRHLLGEAAVAAVAVA